MIACISPGNKSADHTSNTLKYAARLKSDKKARIKNYKPNKAIKKLPPKK